MNDMITITIQSLIDELYKNGAVTPHTMLMIRMRARKQRLMRISLSG